MPTSIDPFIAQFEIIPNSLRNVILVNAGLKIPSLFAIPTQQVQADVVKFLRMLQDYENAPSTDKITALNQIIDKLELGVLRPAEEPNDVLIFYPKRDKKQALKVGAVYGRRFGKIKVNNDPSTGTVNNFCHIEEHVGQDGTTDLGIDQFMKGYGKFFLLNASSPHVMPNPNKGKIKYFSDPAHSNTTIFVAFLTELLQNQYPDMPVIITHGMDGGAHFQLLLGNCFNGKFFRNGRKSFANLLSIALACQDFGDIPIVSVASEIPGFIVKHGQRIPMSPKPKGKTTSALRYPGSVLNTNVDGHIGNFAQNVLLNRGRQTDRTIHLESGPRFRAIVQNPDRPNRMRDKYCTALQNAIRWFALYDPAIHDPWALETRFPEIYNDMNQYDTLFTPEFIAQYQQTAKYSEDASNYAKIYSSAEITLGSLARYAAADEEDPNPEDSADEEDYDLDLGPTVTDDTPPTVEALEDDIPKPLLFRSKTTFSATPNTPATTAEVTHPTSQFKRYVVL